MLRKKPISFLVYWVIGLLGDIVNCSMRMYLPSNADNNAGYLYDYYRQRGEAKREEREKYLQLKKKVDKLSKKNHYIKPKK